MLLNVGGPAMLMAVSGLENPCINARTTMKAWMFVAIVSS